MRPGPHNDLSDVAGLAIGQAEDPALKSGVTVVIPDAPMTTSVHVMGGAPGTRETDLLAPDKTVDGVHGLVLAGGSAFGLDAAAGVMDALAQDGIGFAVGPARVPIVPAAILFDLLNGGDKGWARNPYRDLGAAAYAARTRAAIGLGATGAGCGAIAGRLKGGLGSASLILPSGITVAALVACNALGNVTSGRDGRFWAAPFEIGGEFGGLGPNSGPVDIAASFDTKLAALADGVNTTIGIIATDATLTKAEAQRVATAAHDGLARAIMPAHTPMDGDLIFAGATGHIPLPEAGHAVFEIGHAAALCMARAIARGVHAAKAAPGDTVPCWQDRFG